MKVNFKKLMTAISAISIFAVTMAVSATANAAGKIQNSAKTENKILVENVKQTAIAYSYNPDRTAVTIINNPSHMVTYVFPETVITGTYGTNLKSGIINRDPSQMVTYVFPATVITGTYGTNIKGGIYERNNAPEVLQADDVVYLNAYNQVAGHAIKTTTVSVNR
jgi:hypothetical protein